MNIINTLENIATELKKLTMNNKPISVSLASDRQFAQKICTEGRNATIVVFLDKASSAPPKDWLSPQQWCDYSIGLLISQRQRNQPRQTPIDDDLRGKIISSLQNMVAQMYQTTPTFQSLETLETEDDLQHILMLFHIRGLIAPS